MARNTVIIAYEQLLAEGYFRSKTGSGTYVTETINLPGRPGVPVGNQRLKAVRERKTLSARGRRMVTHAEIHIRAASGTIHTPFSLGVPALDQFPKKLWAGSYARLVRSLTPSDLSYTDEAGYGPLRGAISQYLASGRGIKCSPEQVIVVNGSQQALDIVSRIIVDENDFVYLEDPCYIGARSAFLGSGVKLVPVPVDQDGISIDHFRKPKPSARLVYVTPSHQFPLGVTLGLTRRLQLLHWAKKHSSWILEDDYDSEFRYRGRPLEPLYALDTHQRVIYMSTFSKILFPGLRLGYVIVP